MEELVGLLLCCYKGDPAGCLEEIARIAAGRRTLEFLPAELSGQARHCFELAIQGPARAGADGLVISAADIMGAEFLCEAASAWLDAEARVKWGVDVRREVEMTAARLALRARPAGLASLHPPPARRDAPPGGSAEPAVGLPRPNTVIGADNRPQGKATELPLFGSSTASTALMVRTPASSDVGLIRPSGVAVPSQRRLSEDDAELVAEWPQVLLDCVRTPRARMLGGVLGDAVGVSVDDGVLTIFTAKESQARCVTNPAMLKVAQDLFSSRLGAPVRVKFKCDAHGNCPKTPIPRRRR